MCLAEEVPSVDRSQLTKAEKVRRLVGISAELDQEDLEYWRNASDQTRGRALYKLLALSKALRRSAGYAPPEEPMFPGFPKRPRDLIKTDE